MIGDEEVLECPAHPEGHTRLEWHTLGYLCARCGEHTGNNHQGHYWRWCKVTGTLRDFHMCCPGNCELEA